MVTHTDEMIGDVIAALKSHGRWDDLLILFSAGAVPPALIVLATCSWLSLGCCVVLRSLTRSALAWPDNGGPGNEGWTAQERWDPNIIERNYPCRSASRSSDCLSAAVSDA